MRLTSGIKRILERDPCQQLLNQLELVQGKASMTTLRKVIKASSKPRSEEGWIHATDSTLSCDRLLAGALLGVQPPRSFLPPKTRRIFDNGTHMHFRFQSYFYCLPSPFVVRAPLLLRRWPFTGEADIAVEHPELGKWIIELKSMNTMQWRSLTKPLSGHTYQLNCYLGLVGGDWAGQIWYENKNTQELKLYRVDFDRKMWKEVWDRGNRVAWEVMEGRLPDLCGGCPDPPFCGSDIAITPERLEMLKCLMNQS